ncbi:restriction endonuclease subunit S [Dysosmobacter sp. NSJ-60]|nr:restriction endonuclease subunit S [Dysosmobacter hominis]
MNETKKPAVRFEGFSDEWKQHPMGELTTELHEYATLDSLYPLLTSSREGIMFQNEYRSNRTTENSKTLFSIVPYGKCTYRHMSDDDIFHFNINDIVENGLVSREYPVFDSKDNNDLRFIVALLNSSKQFRKFCRERKIGGTRTRLYYKDLSKFKPLCPEFDEQQSIAEFFNGITSIISEHESKLEKLQALKASMLEKMFPKDEADVPEIRFKGFTGAWKKYSFKNITYPSGTKNKDNIPYESYSITNESGFVPQNEKFENGGTMKNADKRMYIIVAPHSFAYNPARINVGSIGYQYLDYNVIVSSLYEVFKTTDECNDQFLWYWFKTKAFDKMIEQLQEGGVRLYFYYDKLCMCSLKMPDVEEQSKIAEYFKILDNLISACSKELDKLQSIKKALLEKMFV